MTNNVFNRGFDGENYQKIEIANAVLNFIPDLHIDTLTEGEISEIFKKWVIW